MKARVAILGAGITGCTVARLLQQRGFEDFVLLEAEEEPGGLCRTRQVGPHVLDIGGGHFLCSRFPEVYAFVFAHLPESAFARFSRVSKVRVGGEVIDYPIELNLWQLSAPRARAFLESCLAAGEVTGAPPPESFAGWIRWKLGERIAAEYMLPYNRKIWGVPPDAMDVDWLEKLPRVDPEAIRTAFAERRSDRSRMPSHESFYYPREGGFQRIFDAIAASVRDRIWCGRPVARLERAGDGWRVNDGDVEARFVVSTLPWGTVHAAAGGDGALADAVARLAPSSLVVSLHEEAYAHDWHWCYCPDEAQRHHREFFIHNFAPHSAPSGVYRETNGERWDGSARALHVHRNEAAYPIPLRGHAAALARVRDHYAGRNLFGVGRWGQHAYFNSDVCIREAMRFVERLALRLV